MKTLARENYKYAGEINETGDIYLHFSHGKRGCIGGAHPVLIEIHSLFIEKVCAKSERACFVA